MPVTLQNFLLFFQVVSKDAAVSTSALAQLDELIKDQAKVVLLSERMDQLLISCCMQYRHVLNNKLRTDNANTREVLRLFQVNILCAILQNLVSLFQLHFTMLVGYFVLVC
jgi:hypothetical protein